MGKLLLDSEPLIIIPELAVKVGLNESIILQQIHYWLEINKKTKNNFKENFYWTYNTYEEWQEQFPFWSVSTIKRTVYKLEKMGLLISTSKFNKLKIDKTKWYRLDYKVLENLEDSTTVQNDTSLKTATCQNATSQDDITSVSKRNVDHVNLNQALPETSTEITTNIEEEEIAHIIIEYTKAKDKKPTAKEKEILIYLVTKYSKGLVDKAITIAVEQAREVNLKYVKTVLEDWYSKELKTIEKVEAHITTENNSNKEARNKRRSAVNKKTKNDNIQWGGYENERGADYYNKFEGMLNGSEPIPEDVFGEVQHE